MKVAFSHDAQGVDEEGHQDTPEHEQEETRRNVETARRNRVEAARRSQSLKDQDTPNNLVPCKPRQKHAQLSCWFWVSVGIEVSVGRGKSIRWCFHVHDMN